MTKHLTQWVVASIFVPLSGCAGIETEDLRLTQPRPQPVQHPLSYAPISQVSHTEMEVVDVGFNQRYDVYCVLIPDSSTVYRNCRILGMTGQDEEGKSASFSSEWKGHWDANLFDGMLVLETEDGRRAYIPPGSVKYIEEAAETSQVPRQLPLSEL